MFTRAYFDRLRPYFLENWYPKIAPYSIPTELVPLTLDEARALRGRYRGSDPTPMPALTSKLAVAMQRLAGEKSVFVRLGSRSPKDVPEFQRLRGRTRLASEALHWLRSSRRIADDLDLGLNYQYTPVIAVRQWRAIEPWLEFRCFIQERQLVGTCQLHLALGEMPQIAADARNMARSIRGFCAEFVEMTRLRRGVLDLYLEPDPRGGSVKPYRVTLVEINPWMPPTEALLFDWQPGAFDGSFRYIQN